MSTTKVPVTEIASFPVLPGLKPGEGQENFFGIDAGVGYQGGHFGWQVEDKNVFHWILNWDSHEAHVKLINAPEYVTLVQKITAWSSAPTFYHAAFTPHPPTGAFTSPVTEVAKLAIKISKEEWLVSYEKFEVGLKIAPGYRAHSVGWTVEDEKDFVLAIGWDSVEAHTDWAKSEAGVESIGHLLGGVGDHGLWHMRLGGAVTSPGL